MRVIEGFRGIILKRQKCIYFITQHRATHLEKGGVIDKEEKRKVGYYKGPFNTFSSPVSLTLLIIKSALIFPSYLCSPDYSVLVTGVQARFNEA